MGIGTPSGRGEACLAGGVKEWGSSGEWLNRVARRLKEEGTEPKKEDCESKECAKGGLVVAMAEEVGMEMACDRDTGNAAVSSEVLFRSSAIMLREWQIGRAHV